MELLTGLTGRVMQMHRSSAHSTASSLRVPNALWAKPLVVSNQSPLVVPSARLPVQHLHQRQVICRPPAAAFADPADVIPSAYDDDDEDNPGRVKPNTKQVLVVGGGPTGVLTAIYMARRGYNVDLHEKQASPTQEGQPTPNYPMVLSSRALLAFTELKLKTKYNSSETKPFRGTYTIMTGSLQPGGDPSHEHSRSVLVDRAGLVQELFSEARRLYPNKIRFHFNSNLTGLSIEQTTATFADTSSLAGSLLSAGADRRKRGRVMSVSGLRPTAATREQAAQPTIGGIPAWDTAALEAAGLLPSQQDSTQGSTAGVVPRTVEARYDYIIGADGAESRVRQLMLQQKSKVKGLSSYTPTLDSANFKYFSGVQLTGRELVPGMSGHGPGEYLYCCSAPGAPGLEMYKSEAGLLAGIVTVPAGGSWEVQSVTSQLQAAYGSKVQQELLADIARQACVEGRGAPASYGRVVHCTQYHGPKAVLIGDAAHSVTNESRQGFSAAVESVRLFNVILKVTGENLARVGSMFTDMRREDVHCLQTLEQMQRGLKPGVVYGDGSYAFAGWIGRLVWKAAAMMVGMLALFSPRQFRQTWVTEQLGDNRIGYSEVIKVLARYAALPVIAVLSVVAYLLRGPIAAMIRSF